MVFRYTTKIQNQNKIQSSIATVNIKISQFLLAFDIKQKNITYPEGVNSQTDLVTYLLDKQNPKAIQIRNHGENFLLRNRACDESVKDIIQAVRDPKGLYQQLQFWTSNNRPKYFIEKCDYLTRYYLKLQTECYCRVNKINMNDLLSSKIKEDLLNYLNLKNQVNSQDLMEHQIREQARIRGSLEATQYKIDQLNFFYERRQSWYKRMAVLITAGHLVSFGYMIFGVEWLGWDIIQPLTYTVGSCLYTVRDQVLSEVQSREIFRNNQRCAVQYDYASGKTSYSHIKSKQIVSAVKITQLMSSVATIAQEQAGIQNILASVAKKYTLKLEQQMIVRQPLIYS